MPDRDVTKMYLTGMEVVREFSEVFPDELPGLPPPLGGGGEGFQIDLLLGAAPITKVPDRLDLQQR